MTDPVTPTAADLLGARTLLFVPGDRPERFAKAAASGADLIVLDLEDAVAPAAKPEARAAVREWLAAGNPGTVRINPPGTEWYGDDVAAVVAAAGAAGAARAAGPAPVMLPKAQDPAEVAALVAALGPAAQVVPLVETALGVHRAVEVCGVAGVVRAGFGSVDLASELGVDPVDREALRFARSALVLGSRAAGAGAPIDGVTTAVRDEQLLLEDCAHGLSLGFTAKMCIHPAQVGPVATAFSPTPEQVEWARAVVGGSAGGGVAVVDGKMIDKPVVERARALLLRAGEPA
ncbi:CoA ester lyase [Pseudonocardia kujensis]|uniref:HpcH/HpaI aldolase/citrate lyase family protein n=1 Tax=Pseudonocardia kujensis TaxID=1128675 RepID=UPI001E41EEED|nr:CoA ester lyase [Pseudonocardia kujensis]MCE0762805.1 CoA ester lyase [Pseudonocardia kujensis]